MKNINAKEKLKFKNEVNYQKGQVMSKTLAQNASISVTIFAFDQDEEIPSHKYGGDALITCLEGVGKITIDEDVYELEEDESNVMPAGHPHAVYAKEKFKMLLVVIF